MISNGPQVSIGLPVFNGENYLAEALDSILAQTFLDFELIISDNASTDRTQKICETYAAKDDRIRYYRSPKNLGMAWNFNHAFELSVGEYFKWSAHDDLLAPNFLAKCVVILDQDPSVVLCYPKARIIDEQGHPLEDYNVKLNTDSPRPQDRFGDLLLAGHRCFEIFGVIRASALRMTPLLGSYGHTDGVLLARLGFLGRFYEVPEHLFFPRKHLEQSMEKYMKKRVGNVPDYREYEKPIGQLNKFPHWTILREYNNTIWQAPLSWPERIRCYFYFYKWIRRFRHLLTQDFVVVAKQALVRSSINFN